MQKTAIVWFRNDLRIVDNPALRAAVASGLPVIPVFVWAPQDEDGWAPGAASRWWLHYSLESLDASLRAMGSRLVILKGSSVQTLVSLVREANAEHVYWNHRYEPWSRACEEELSRRLSKMDALFTAFHGNLLIDPSSLVSKSGGVYKVFTAYWKAATARLQVERPLPAPSGMKLPAKLPKSNTVQSLKLLPEIDWASGLREAWVPGEPGAKAQLRSFIKHELASYVPGRDLPADDSVSRLSPHLHFGEISPRAVWHAVTMQEEANANKGLTVSAETYLKEIGWREFANYLIFHFPHTSDNPLRQEFKKFPWKKNTRLLKLWHRGLTGYPIVDAGMRQLWHSGWMHNRIRMVVASFLVKDLLIAWQEGAKWFWDTLVDADLANNTLGWQWAGGCGADAAPYFRVFNPQLQGEKFDPQGEYVRRWVPELRNLESRWIHHPWDAPEDALRRAGVSLGKDYPHPVVDHSSARQSALAAFATIRSKA